MSYQLTWMPGELLGAGLKVAECEGWRERGRADMGRVRGVMCHHTGNPQPGNMPTLGVLIRGRPDLKGPLCNLGLGRDGTFYVVAAGRANHAGPGRWKGIETGNGSFIGIEAEHSGDPKEPWPPAQKEAYRRGVAALLKHVGADADMCVGHLEYALPAGRKVDPCFGEGMAAFRNDVFDFLAGASPTPPIKALDESGRPTLRRGDEGDPVERLQDLLGVRSDGEFGPRTEAALRDRQRRHGLTADGICGPKSWAALLASPQPQPQPQAAAPAGSNGGGLTIGDKGVSLIHDFESCARRTRDGRFAAYPDPGSKTGRPWTIGWGSTGPDVKDGVIWDQPTCDARFARDILRYVGDVNRALAGAATTQDQFDALVSFHYNTGAIATATLTRLHRNGDYDAASREFGRWVKNDGKVMMGLVRRREAEMDLYVG